jgi:hypothetical protein
MKGIWGNLTTGVIAGAFLCTSALATTVGPGNFYLTGEAIGTTTGINFTLTSGADDQTAAVIPPESGVFTDLAVLSTQSIQNLTSGNGVTPGSSFDFKNWVQLSDGIDLDATAIPVETTVPVCTGSESVGQSCRPNAASPVILTQGATGVSAKLSVTGVAHTGLSGTDYLNFSSLFTAPTTNYSTISAFLAAYNSMGGIPPVGYSADFIVSAGTSSVPEPGSMILLASGLLGFGLLRKRKASR